MHDFEYQITNSIFVIRYSIFELPMFFVFLGWKTFLSIRKVFEYQIFNIKTNRFNARFWISNYQFDIRYSIFELPLFFVFLGSKTFFSIRKVTEYQIFNIKTDFECTILNIKLSIRYS